jgi:hypothetical protein
MNKTIKNCKFFLKKNGKVIHTESIINDLFCFVKGYKNVYLLNFNDFNGIDENYIINKLLLFQRLKEYNLKYLYIDSRKIYLYNNNDKNIEKKLIFILFIDYLTKIKKYDKYLAYFYGSELRRLSTYFMFLRLIFKNISDQNILIKLFFDKYINDNDVTNYLKKHHLDKNSFSNYQQIYYFLKEGGLVDKYYNKYSPKIIKKYRTMYNKFSKLKKFKEFKNKELKKVKFFKDLDLLDVVDKNVNKRFNKEFIKNKFIELAKKYNI